jgi:hypothetical protein
MNTVVCASDEATLSPEQARRTIRVQHVCETTWR